MAEPQLISRNRKGRVILFIVLGTLALAALLVWLNLSFIKDKIREYRVRAALAAANGLRDQGRADLGLARVLETLRRYPDDPELLSGAAVFFETLGDPVALAIRQKIAASRPEDPAALLDLVSSLIKFGRHRDAETVLQQLAELPQEKTAPQQSNILFFKGVCLMARNEHRAARDAFLESKRLDPSNEAAEFNAILMGLSLGPPESEEAAEALRRFESRPEYAERVAAARVAAALNNPSFAPTDGDKTRLLENLEKLSRPESDSFRTLLTALLAWQPERLRPVLEQLLTSPSVLPGIKAWHLRAVSDLGQSGLVRSLLRDTKDKAGVLDQQPLALLAAELAVAASDKEGLREILSGPAWSAMPVQLGAFRVWLARDSETVRKTAFAALAERGRADPEGLVTAAMLLERWGLPESLEAWETLVLADVPQSRQALSLVVSRILAAGDTARLRAFFRKLSVRFPRDTGVETRLVYLSLLLGDDSKEWLTRAEKLGVTAPNDPDAIAVHALALHRAGQSQKALQMISRIPEESFQSPIGGFIAAYLLSQQNPALSRRLIERHQAALYLPEEKQLAQSLLQQTAPPDKPAAR